MKVKKEVDLVWYGPLQEKKRGGIKGEKACAAVVYSAKSKKWSK